MRGNTAILKYFPPNAPLPNLFDVAWFKDDDNENRIALKLGAKYAVTTMGDLLVKDVTDRDASCKFYSQFTNKLNGKSVRSQPGQIILLGTRLPLHRVAIT